NEKSRPRRGGSFRLRTVRPRVPGHDRIQRQRSSPMRGAAKNRLSRSPEKTPDHSFDASIFRGNDPT
ncbi:hypothetical protein, partial [Methylorubrum podarium]|uniref:hypothetical protein n=1 Tax=Methylorubrum podarium TaxID=200476 RepID=UPI001EE1C603